MATRGFEFAYMLDGTNAVPVTQDFTLGTTTSAKVGDVYTIQSDGYIDEQTASVGEVTCILQEASSSPTAGTTAVKAAIVTRNQVWRCSTDATTCAAVTGYTKTLDLADQNTIDASDVTNGSLTKVSADTDDDGNVSLYVVFADTTFGNT
jgi:hypothetical protein